MDEPNIDSATPVREMVEVWDARSAARAYSLVCSTLRPRLAAWGTRQRKRAVVASVEDAEEPYDIIAASTARSASMDICVDTPEMVSIRGSCPGADDATSGTFINQHALRQPQAKHQQARYDSHYIGSDTSDMSSSMVSFELTSVDARGQSEVEKLKRLVADEIDDQVEEGNDLMVKVILESPLSIRESKVRCKPGPKLRMGEPQWIRTARRCFRRKAISTWIRKSTAKKSGK